MGRFWPRSRHEIGLAVRVIRKNRAFTRRLFSEMLCPLELLRPPRLLLKTHTHSRMLAPSAARFLFQDGWKRRQVGFAKVVRVFGRQLRACTTSTWYHVTQVIPPHNTSAKHMISNQCLTSRAQAKPSIRHGPSYGPTKNVCVVL